LGRGRGRSGWEEEWGRVEEDEWERSGGEEKKRR
jgi:hypothetical protein